MISNEKVDISLKHESILLGIALLLGGNRASQDGFFNYLQINDHRN